jgi:hypothetical protein
LLFLIHCQVPSRKSTSVFTLLDLFVKPCKTHPEQKKLWPVSRRTEYVPCQEVLARAEKARAAKNSWRTAERA